MGSAENAVSKLSSTALDALVSEATKATVSLALPTLRQRYKEEHFQVLTFQVVAFSCLDSFLFTIVSMVSPDLIS